MDMVQLTFRGCPSRVTGTRAGQPLSWQQSIRGADDRQDRMIAQSFHMGMPCRAILLPLLVPEERHIEAVMRNREHRRDPLLGDLDTFEIDLTDQDELKWRWG